ncbi:MAG: long-chain N-acyl amino acid synthase [Nitrosospira sp.]|nr:long-chain N-acyl amino acid synthase [Nitrosospira sp.]MDN5835796.1 long-chain N-acyl amino acid synthase [Nitrosospira sp.]MDN5881797.1 long-chain N-acyl amino acid synthase [Nitrosospira sp.]
MQLDNDANLRVNRPHPYLPAAKAAGYFKSGSSSIENEEFLYETLRPNCVLTQGDYSIYLADSPKRCSLVNKLITRMYSRRGYDTESAAVFSHDDRRITFEASSKHEPFGTLTLGIDSEKGLLADELYEKEINAFRLKNKKVCEVSKLAVDSTYGSKEVLASLFHLAYIYARTIHKASDAFIEVNPRHAGFYKRMLGFQAIGEVRTCQRVGAPAVLLHLELDYMDTQISSLAGLREVKDKSLYPYFFPRYQEEGLARRLTCHLN